MSSRGREAKSTDLYYRRKMEEVTWDKKHPHLIRILSGLGDVLHISRSRQETDGNLRSYDGIGFNAGIIYMVVTKVRETSKRWRSI